MARSDFMASNNTVQTRSLFTVATEWKHKIEIALYVIQLRAQILF